MTLPRLYQDPLPKGGEFSLDKDNAHIAKRVLRLSQGDTVELFDGRGGQLTAEIFLQTKKGCQVRTLKKEAEPPPRTSITLFQSLPKSATFDTVLRQVTELGAAQIVPLISERTVRRPAAGQAEKNLARWQTILQEACRQCGRNWLPRIESPIPFAAGLKQAAKAELTLFFWEESSGQQLAQFLRGQSLPATIAIIVGPEGGFSETEAGLAREQGALTLSLGKNILKVDSAAALAIGTLKLFSR